MLILKFNDELHLVENLREARMICKADRFLDRSCLQGQQGLWVVENKERQTIASIVDPLVFKNLDGNLLYKEAFDNNGKFSVELFKQNYKAT